MDVNASLQNYVLLEEFGDGDDDGIGIGIGVAFELDALIERHNFKQATSAIDDSFDFDDDDDTNEEGAATPSETTAANATNETN